MDAIAARCIADNFNTKQFWLGVVYSKIEEYAKVGLYSAGFFLEFVDARYVRYQANSALVEQVLSELRSDGYIATLRPEVVSGAYITVSWDYNK